MNEELGKTIRILRDAKGYSMSEMARRCGVSTAFLSLVEKGDRHPSLKSLRSMAKALGLPSDALLQIAMGSGVGGSVPTRTIAISEAVQQLINVEDKLRSLLTKKETKGGPEPDHACQHCGSDGAE
jgi:transcriptional regulator with XRE-family HTH domain